MFQYGKTDMANVNSLEADCRGGFQPRKEHIEVISILMAILTNRHDV
jgi:hypothetical protein